MASFPPLPQIVGKHGGYYEAYYLQADPMGTGSIGALDAANFLKKSKLKDSTLSQIWDLSDPTGKGYLEKTGFFVALKLISLVQSSQDMSVSKLATETPPPDLGPVEPVDVSASNSAVGNVPWDVTLSEKSKYDKVFDDLHPVNNMLSGDKVKPVLINSRLPVDVLGRIWDLSDIDKDGYLDRDEFALAMHLVYKAMEGHETPTVIKPSLIPPSKREGGGIASPPMPGAVPVLPGLGAGLPGITPAPAKPTWVVTAAEKSKADILFTKLDLDKDGFVTGAEMRDTLAQSGLPNTTLAHIWSLCDIKNTGKLNHEQFALTLHLIQNKLKGVEPPSQLPPDMIPPSMKAADPGAFGVRDSANSGLYSHVADISAIKELDQLSKEIEDIKREKLQLERDKGQQEADIKIRHSEVQVLQKELDSLNVTLSQLDSQKKEAQKRLDELDDKRSNLERNVKELREQTDTEQMEVNKMKSLLTNGEQIIKDQERELEKLRLELTQLRDEETKLEQTVDSSKQQLEQLARSQTDITNQVTMTKKRVDELQEQYKGLDTSSLAGLTTVNGDDRFTRDAAKATVGSSASSLSNFSMASNLDDPFKGKDPFGNSAASVDAQSDPFHSEDPFKDSDPFKSADPFGSEDPFKDAFGSSSSTKPDMFGSVDPFGTSASGSKDAPAFDAFASAWASDSSSKSSHKPSAFSSDPFGESTKQPSLPSKKKAPPPRPAPPKSKSPLPFAKSKVDPPTGFDSDPFGGNDPFSNTGANKPVGSASDPFSNFADFSPGKFTDESGWSVGESRSTSGEAWGGESIRINTNGQTKPQALRRNINFNSHSGADQSEA